MVTIFGHGRSNAYEWHYNNLSGRTPAAHATAGMPCPWRTPNINLKTKNALKKKTRIQHVFVSLVRTLCVLVLTPTSHHVCPFVCDNNFPPCGLLQSHRTMTRIKNMSSFRMVLFLLVLSLGSAASSVPYWQRWFMSGTAFYMGGITAVRWMGDFAVHVCQQRITLL